MSRVGWVGIGLGVWGATLSTFLAVRQVLRERRRLRVIARILGTFVPDDPSVGLTVYEVRAHNEGARPIFVTQAGVITEDGQVFHPMTLQIDRRPSRLSPPCMLSQGETATFYIDLLSFENGWLPKAVWVQDDVDRRYTARVSRKERHRLATTVESVRKHVGSDIESQRDLLDFAS